MNKQQVNVRSLYKSKYNSSRYSLLAMLVFTVINIGLALMGSLSYYVFSANIPYTLVIEGMYLTGGLPDEIYADLPSGYEFYSTDLLIPLVIVAAVIIVFYLVCFFLSGKFRTGWLIAATVAFVIDTLFMIVYYGISIDALLDLVLHALMIYYLVNGIINGIKLKKLPPEEFEAVAEEVPEVPFVSDESAASAAMPEAPVAPEEAPVPEIPSEDNKE